MTAKLSLSRLLAVALTLSLPGCTNSGSIPAPDRDTASPKLIAEVVAQIVHIPEDVEFYAAKCRQYRRAPLGQEPGEIKDEIYLRITAADRAPQKRLLLLLVHLDTEDYSYVGFADDLPLLLENTSGIPDSEAFVEGEGPLLDSIYRRSSEFASPQPSRRPLNRKPMSIIGRITSCNLYVSVHDSGFGTHG